MNAPALPQAQAALSAAQRKAALWADDGVGVYAVVMGQRVADLQDRLAKAAGLDYHCLLPGALSIEEQAAAPYVARLDADAPFTDWLLFEAAAGFGDWGVLVRSRHGLIDMRSHARALRQALTAAGQAIVLDWMDPAVLRALLPLAQPEQLQQIFAPLQSLLVLEPTRWTAYSLSQLGGVGRLQTQVSHAVGAA